MSYRNHYVSLIYKYIIWPLEALILFLVYFVISVIPFKISSLLMGCFFRIIGPLSPWHNRANKQLKLAMPNLNHFQRKKILSDMWSNLGRTLGEFPHINKMLKLGFIKIEGIEKIKNQNGCFIVGAHLGNWEILGLLGKYLGKESGIVYRKLNNPFANKLLLQRAKNTASEIFEKGQHAANGMFRVMKKDGLVFILADQQLREGISVSFFGKPANTSIAHIKIAQKLKKPIILAQTIRLKNCNHLIKIRKIIITKDTSEVSKIATLINSNFEKWIIENPEQWLWPHRRWGKK